MIDPRFTQEKLERRLAELQAHLFLRRQPLSLLWQPGRLGEADPGRWEPCPAGMCWGGLDSWAAFRASVKTPPGWENMPIAAVLRLNDQGEGGEGLLYLDGLPYQGVDRHHQEVWLTAAARPDQAWELALDAYTISHGADRPFRLAEASLAVPDPAAVSLYYDALAALDAVRVLPEQSLDRALLLEILDRALVLVDWRAPLGGDFRSSLAAAALRSGLAPLAAGNQPRLTAVGHSHIDVAWLWPLAQTRQKAARTFATVLRLMERYPEYHFVQSQPQLYSFVKEDHPTLWAQVKARAAEGRWEPIGGMWVEADCNLSGGEALIRQFLFGTRFFRREFGTAGSPVLWLPDVFGYPWALPQIIAGCGLKYFMTTKISWNEYNRLPYDSFRWRGPDGTEIVAHFITAPSDWQPLATSLVATYSGMLNAAEVKGAWDNYRQKRLHHEVLLAFGHGDGGGGPTAGMLEYAGRLKDMPGLPRVAQGAAAGFFDRLAAKADALPVWHGELYFEYHRGTYTTQAANKRANRQSELLYHEAELFAALAHLWGADYPRETLNRGWEWILLNQFHDILPGSSIAAVYEESRRQYAELQAWGRAARDKALDAIAAQVDLPAASLLIFNSTCWERDDAVEAELPAGRDLQPVGPSGPLPYQVVADDGSRRRIVFHAPGVPPHGYLACRLEPGEPSAPGGEGAVTVAPAAPGYALENRFFRVLIDWAGRIASWWDKEAGREVMPAGGKGNQLQAFEDKPLNFDAWDINLFYQDKMWAAEDPAEIEVLEAGPVRAVLGVRRRFMHSSIFQRITAYARLPRLDFVTEVDWREKHVLLKAAFPVNVHALAATYDIQFGNVERPTHWNTSWDWARFEVCAHKWADLSEGDYGVSLLNDCKYGYDIKDNVMRLSLLRSPADPDPHADEGRHVFTYSLYPHRGGWREGATVRRAYELNLPLLARHVEPHRSARPGSYCLVRADAGHVVVETVKGAEDADAAGRRPLIVRVYECYNQRGPVTLTFGAPILAAAECNLVEEDDRPADFHGCELRFQITPYQIRTFRVSLDTA